MLKNINRRDILKGSVAVSLGIMAGENTSGAVDEDPFPPLTIVKKTPETYSPLAYLEKVAGERKPLFAFSASSPNEADVWQKKLRVRLWELIGEDYRPGENTPAGKLLETRKLDGYTQEKWELNVVPGRSMPFYVLTPDSVRKPYRTALCLHGHGNGAKDIINMPLDKEVGELIRILNTDYALQTVKRGWCAVAPDLFAFGERVDFVEGARPGFDGGTGYLPGANMISTIFPAWGFLEGG